jgi:hypothetical protein
MFYAAAKSLFSATFFFPAPVGLGDGFTEQRNLNLGIRFPLIPSPFDRLRTGSAEDSGRGERGGGAAMTREKA